LLMSITDTSLLAELTTHSSLSLRASTACQGSPTGRSVSGSDTCSLVWWVHVSRFKTDTLGKTVVSNWVLRPRPFAIVWGR
jgi:hypothetical protein